MLVTTLKLWLKRLAKVLGVVLILLAFSTLVSFIEFIFTKNKYPRVSYAEPSFRPEVTWQDQMPSDWVRLDQMSRAAWVAVIAAEDGGFFAHKGVELEQSLKKIRADIKKGKVPGGISTLNQQVVKNIYFGGRHPLTRKLQEAFIAREMDAELEKKKILEIYLNVAEWGPGVVGIGSAARFYFGKAPSRLSERESAILANMLPNPRGWSAAVKKGRLPASLARAVRRTMRRMNGTNRVINSQISQAELKQTKSLTKFNYAKSLKN